jgi:WD repeat-containing protein 68
MHQLPYSQQQQQPQQHNHSPQRISSPAYSQSDELHLASPSQQQQQQQSQSQSQTRPQYQQQQYHRPQQQRSQSQDYHQQQHPHPLPSTTTQSSAETPSVPNVLQPAGGLAPRPAPLSHSGSYGSPTNPTTTVTLPPLNMQMSPQQNDYRQPPPAGPYSRGSPAVGGGGSGSSSGYESGYHAYTPVTPSGPSAGFMSPGGSQRMPNAPLGLADIRPRADSGISDGGPGTLAYELAHPQPGTSNYLAPWTAYAFDWCKWTPGGSGAGKLALASYLEDGHNFVRPLWVFRNHSHSKSPTC